jgi:hypothetical protein
MATSEKVSALYLDMQLKTAQFKAAINEASGEMQKFSRQMKEESAKSRESVKLLSEELGMGIPRGLQGIISKLPGVTTAMNAAFDAVVVFALIDTVVKLTEKVTEFAKKSEEAAKKHKAAWGDITGSIVESNDKATLVNLKLEDATRKLEHKPAQNAMKIALEESIIAAEELGKKLDSDMKKISGELKAQGLGGMFFGGASDQDMTDKQASLSTRIKATTDQASIDRRAPGANPAEIDRKMNADLKALYEEGASFGNEIVKNARIAKDAQENPGKYPESYSAGFNSGNMDTRISKGLGMAGSYSALSSSIDIAQTTSTDTASHEKAEERANSAKVSTEADKKRLEDVKKRLEQIKAVNAMSLQEEVDFWKGMAAAPGLSKGAKALMGDEANTSQAALTRHNASEQAAYKFDFTKQLFENQGKKIEESKPASLDETYAGMQKADAETVAAQKKAANEIYQNTVEDIDQKEKLAELIIKLNETNGKITASQAAQQMKAVHNSAIADTNTALGTAQNNGAGIGLKEIEKQNGQNQIQQIQDDQAVWSSSFSGSMDNAFNQLIQRGQDFNAQFKDLLDTTVNSVNDSIIKMMTEKDHRGVWKDTGKQIFTGIAKTGLQDAEGGVMKMLGLGGKGKMGTKGNPMYTKSADTIPGAGGSSASSAGAGGLLGMLNDSDWASSLFGGTLFGSGSFFGGKASGGLMNSGGFYLTGEQGPELLQVGSTSKINNARDTASILNGGGSSTTQHNWNIDCSNANDPAATRAQVMRGIQEAAPSIIAAANGVQKEQSRRLPNMKR